MLALGHLDAAQMLSPMPVAMSLGMGGLTASIDSLMVLSVNGTVFGASTQLATELGDVRFGNATQVLATLAQRNQRPLRVGVPFPFSMHRLLLSYWMQAAPDLRLETVTVPPPRMAEAVSGGHVDAFWVGEPWGSAIVQRGVGQILMTGADVWGFAPEKVLAARHDWVEDNPAMTRKLMRAVYQAGRWLDTEHNKPLAVEILARSEHLNLAPELIDPALSGYLTPFKNASPVRKERFVLFHDNAASFPWRSQAAWIAQRLGADMAGIARAKDCCRADLYRQNLEGIGADLPGASEKIEGAMQEITAVASSRGQMILAPDAFFDGRTFDFTQTSAE
jgi:NitT/TauT family transport system ATP-binding protein